MAQDILIICDPSGLYYLYVLIGTLLLLVVCHPFCDHSRNSQHCHKQ